MEIYTLPEEIEDLIEESILDVIDASLMIKLLSEKAETSLISNTSETAENVH